VASQALRPTDLLFYGSSGGKVTEARVDYMLLSMQRLRTRVAVAHFY